MSQPTNSGQADKDRKRIHPDSRRVAISTRPEKTESGPAWDFAQAVTCELGSFRTGVLYRFGSQYVQFFEHGGKLGADFMRPVAAKQAGLHSTTRVTSTGLRVARPCVTISDHE